VLAIWASALLLFPACGKKAAPVGGSPNAFDSAPAEVKQIWLAALEADKTNGYVAAQTLCYSLLQKSLSPDQQNAVSQQLTSVNTRFQEALQKGDPVAKAAWEEMRRNPPNRQR